MAIDRLRAYYGFSRMPFGRDLAPGALFPSRSHQEALARIAWLVAEGALGVLSGEVGVGNTAAVRAAMAALDHRHSVLYLGNPAVGVRGYYAQIVEALGGTPSFHTYALIAAATERLHAEQVERGKRVVLVVDEAHSLNLAQLDELRFLTNSDMDSSSPFACLLVGQPMLRRRLKLGGFAAVDQRIALRYHLDGMDLAETADLADPPPARRGDAPAMRPGRRLSFVASSPMSRVTACMAPGWWRRRRGCVEVRCWRSAGGTWTWPSGAFQSPTRSPRSATGPSSVGPRRPRRAALWPWTRRPWRRCVLTASPRPKSGS